MGERHLGAEILHQDRCTCTGRERRVDEEVDTVAGTQRDAAVARHERFRRLTVNRHHPSGMTFESQLFKPEKPKKDLRELLEAEATLATQAVVSQLRDIDKVLMTLTAGDKTLATAEAARGRDRLLMTYVDERVKE